MKVKVGPVSLNLSGQITFESIDESAGTVTVRAEASDKRVGGAVRAHLALKIKEIDANVSEIAIHTDASLLGKIGEFGQAIVRKKSDSILEEFAANIRLKLT